jgi:LPXTG-site transpeptidase (sortase) family protein
MQIYEVTRVFSTDPEDIEILRTTEEPHLTLITCDDWNPSRETYDERRVVVAKPTGQQTTSSDGFD